MRENWEAARVQLKGPTATGVYGPTGVSGEAGRAAPPKERSFEDALAKAGNDHGSKTGEARKQEDESGEYPGLRQAVAGFEAYFLQYLLKNMRRAIPDGGLINKGFAGEVYEGMFDQHLAENMADAGGVGLGDILFKQLASAYEYEASLDS